VQIFNQAGFVRGRHFETRALAMLEAEALADVFARSGCRCVRCEGEGWLCEQHRDRPARHDGCTEAGRELDLYAYAASLMTPPRSCSTRPSPG
jgi:hypothetical protein